MIHKFIWNDKRERVKRETMNKNYLEGGLKIINLDTYIEAIQKKMHSWKKRNLTMVGRIMLPKSLIIPNIAYVASVTSIYK